MYRKGEGEGKGEGKRKKERGKEEGRRNRFIGRQSKCGKIFTVSASG